MKNWKIVSKVGCPWCDKAKELLKSKNIDFEVEEVTDRNKVEVISKLNIGNHKTFPIIFYKDQFIGGYSDLLNFLKKYKGNTIANTEKEKVKKRFNGSPYYNLVSMLFLQNKYPDTCVVIPNYKKDMNSLEHSDVSIRYDEYTKELSFPNMFWETFDKCKSKRFIIFPFGYSCKEGGHANYMIYDKKIMSLERFEPYGKLVDIPKSQKKCFVSNIDKLIKVEFNKRGLLKKYYKPNSFVPDNGFQTIQEDENIMNNIDPEGYCSAWSLFYCDLRMTNPDVANDDIIEFAINYIDKNKKSFTEFIRTYANYIVNVSDKLYSNHITSLKNNNKY